MKGSVAQKKGSMAYMKDVSALPMKGSFMSKHCRK
jgi:hypothetical protein